MSRLFSTGSILGAGGSSKMASNFRKVTHCIFDMDGLLLDTEKIYERILGDLIKSYNSTYPWATRMKVLGTTEQRTVSIIVNDLKLSCTVDEFLKKFRQKQLVELGGAPLMRGAEKLIRHLHENNIPIAVATSSGADSVEVKTKNHQDIFNLFHHKVMGSSDAEVKEGKPAPDIFLVAASRFPDKPNPDQCLVFEDAPNGVTAGVAAGMQVVMVPDPHIEEDRRKQATVVLESLEHFKPEMFGLPAFK
ncbi:probable pseudouridine-5'-phosphatase isoform X1 [Uranotaenia lowii]|uniref:probable pseudouridine-5'-phosphatase isoform X1 n=1 Tax=Uranotaenia lowii TaxID=190385 RepID=UPI00247AEDF7|nr:probable pseudouridine-5'-phosphatase isoform X1 [Uranotaenia lowii]XP_055607804.1 probable pseudouridine-5'-phosphatase isoform X1 [Uranotaenia lowii]